MDFLKFIYRKKILLVNSYYSVNNKNLFILLVRRALVEHPFDNSDMFG